MLVTADEVAECDEGCLEILNVGMGHMKFSYDRDDSDEAKKAKAAIEDMMQRGYSIFIEMQDDTLERVKKFDPERSEYIISGPPDTTTGATLREARREKASRCEKCGEKIVAGDKYYDAGNNHLTHERCGPPALRRKKRTERRVPIRLAKATAVGRSAGG